MQAPAELAFPGYNSMVVATWLDLPHKLTQSIESDTGEGMEAALHVGHVLEWLIFFDGPPLLLTLPKIFEELSLQLHPFLLLVGGVIVAEEGPEDVVQVFPPPCTPVVNYVLQRVSRGSPHKPPGCGEGFPGVEDEGILQGTPVGHPPSCQGIGLLVFLMEDPSRPPPGAAGRPTVIVSASANLSPMYIGVPAASGSRLGGRGVKGDSGS